MNETPPQGVPDLGMVTVSTLRQALRRGWRDFMATPGYGVFFGAIYVLGGWFIAWLTWITGQTYWLVFAAIGFPLIGPFAATGLYEISHKRSAGEGFTVADILTVVVNQGKRQLPSLCVMIIVIFLFWFFIAHMIFALFLGLSTMTNVSSSLEVYFTPNGLMMLAFGSAVGGGFALLIFMITVLSLPLLLDREVDFITAIIASFKTVQQNFAVMIGWGAFIAVVVFLAMIPGFLGLLIVLPLFGHSSWHLYDLIKQDIKKGA
jgi:uncharacterized membrane protein